MKLKLKKIRMSAKAEVSLQGKYRLNKNSIKPLMTATAAKSYVQLKVHLCKGTSEALLSRLRLRFSKLVIKDALPINSYSEITSFNILPQKREMN